MVHVPRIERQNACCFEFPPKYDTPSSWVFMYNSPHILHRQVSLLGLNYSLFEICNLFYQHRNNNDKPALFSSNIIIFGTKILMMF